MQDFLGYSQCKRFSPSTTHTFQFGIPPYLQDDNNLLPWMNCFMSLLSRPIPNGQPSNEGKKPIFQVIFQKKEFAGLGG